MKDPFSITELNDLFLSVNLLKTLKGSAFFYYNNVFQAHAGKLPFYYQKTSIENDSELRLRGSRRVHGNVGYLNVFKTQIL